MVRPRKEEAERDAVLHMRVTPEFKASLQESAERLNMTMTDVVIASVEAYQPKRRPVPVRQSYKRKT